MGEISEGARVHRIRASDLGGKTSGGLDSKDVLGAIHSGQIRGLLIEAAFSHEEMEAAVARLEEGPLASFERPLGEDFDAVMLGPVLVRTPMPEYLELHDPWVGACASAFAGLFDIESRFDALFAQISDRPVVVPTENGRPLVPSILRRLPPGGGQIPLHLEVEQALSPTYDGFRERLDGVSIFSFFLTLSPAERGGEISIYETFHEETRAANLRRGRTDDATLLARPRSVVAPARGDFFVFDGGRSFHRVMPVHGSRNRWTAGGFLARAEDGERYYRWA